MIEVRTPTKEMYEKCVIDVLLATLCPIWQSSSSSSSNPITKTYYWQLSPWDNSAGLTFSQYNLVSAVPRSPRDISTKICFNINHLSLHTYQHGKLGRGSLNEQSRPQERIALLSASPFIFQMFQTFCLILILIIFIQKVCWIKTIFSCCHCFI